MGTETPHKPDPVRDGYQLCLSKAYEAACDIEIPMERIPGYIDAAWFFGLRLGKTWDDVMVDAINFSIWTMTGGQFCE